MKHKQDGIDGNGYFDFETLDVYRLSRQAVQFVAARRHKLKGLPGKSGEQLERAVVGAHTNIGSGAHARGAEQKRHFGIARTEAGEAGSACDIALDYHAFTQAEYDELRAILLRICACLRGLIR